MSWQTSRLLLSYINVNTASTSDPLCHRSSTSWVQSYPIRNDSTSSGQQRPCTAVGQIQYALWPLVRKPLHASGNLWASNANACSQTVAALETFYLAIARHPEVQRKAQEEIDRVMDTDQLPTLEDRTRLPYINAVVLESLRWHPIVPLGVPHMSTEDDTYNGYDIPKGSVLLANIW